MYEHADQSWRTQPKFLSPANVELLAERCAQYAVERDLRWITVIAHGGEPALLGAGRLDHLFGTVTDALTAVGVKVNLGMQTNGTMVDAPLVKVLQRHGVRAGVSVDGPRRSTIGIVSTSVERERPYVRWRASNISSTP